MTRVKLILTLSWSFSIFISCCINNQNKNLENNDTLDYAHKNIKIMEHRALVDSSSNSQVVENIDSLKQKCKYITVKGIIRYSGLDNVDKELLELNSDFQIISDKKSFFLKTDEDLSQYLGKYVSVKGKFLIGWNYYTTEINGRLTYDRTALHLINIRTTKPENSSESFHFNTYNTGSKSDTLVGKIKFMRRLAPDINIDYKIELLSPITLSNNAYENHTSEVPNFFHEDVVNINMLNSIIYNNDTILFYGYFKIGYAENYYFSCFHLETK